MELGMYSPSRYRHFLGWGVGMIVAGSGLFPFLVVLMAIGAFDQWHIQGDAQLNLVFTVAVLIVAIGLVLIIADLVKRFKARK
ncbi:MAG: hypothetical protein LBJ65_27805 [Burkholderia sp.]|jgi:hypothetical protein|uniref:hypothetical protein n=1 Tax=Burkholderia sp. TaxID=36773 RepID=UPI0028365A85|nr:hypothetical protein [Burkholderia sp.]MDR0245422.1 hypothetical protein [Burkholderia sp.]